VIHMLYNRLTSYAVLYYTPLKRILEASQETESRAYRGTPKDLPPLEPFVGLYSTCTRGYTTHVVSNYWKFI